LPYTPSYRRGTIVGASAFAGLRDNSARKPNQLTFDLYLNRNFTIQGRTLSIFMNVYNLFDRKNATNVYTDTGKPDYTLDELYVHESPERVGTLHDFFTHPEWYTPPRKVQIGFALEL
jgi:outer membrane receptor protein involved in Fe transport